VDAKRFSVSRTVDGANPVRRAISCREVPANLKRKISRTWRIEILPAGINPLLSQSQKADPTHSQQRLPISPTPGRHHPGIMGDD
jgi:hypothetical protein